VYERYPRRARFSIAHEVSHVLLHREAFRSIQVSSIDDWMQVVANIDPIDYRLLETQANNLAGLLLVPDSRLATETRGIARALVERGHMQPGQVIPARFLAETLGDVFDVSRGTIIYRVKADGVYQLPGFRIPSDL
jgi:Zn-dependent peptidase ImmA (M78 family)